MPVRVVLGTSTTSPAYEWRSVIQPYLKNLQILACPSNPNSRIYYNGDCAFVQIPGFPSVPRSYGWATATGSATPSNSFSYGWNAIPPLVAQVQSPAEVLTVVETLTSCTDHCAWCGGNAFCLHNGVGQFAFADGHAKAMKWTATYTPRLMWTFDGTLTGVDARTNPANAVPLIRAECR